MGGFLALGSLLFFAVLFLGAIFLVLYVLARAIYWTLFVAAVVTLTVRHWRETWMYRDWVAWRERRRRGA